MEELISKLSKVCPEYIAKIIVYHYTPKEKRQAWKEFSETDEHFKGKTLKSCEELLTRDDAQLGLQMYQKHMKIYNLNKLYDSMLEKALDGDINAAKWVENFMKSDFFDDSVDEIDEFLSGINIPGLK